MLRPLGASISLPQRRHAQLHVDAHHGGHALRRAHVRLPRRGHGLQITDLRLIDLGHELFKMCSIQKAARNQIRTHLLEESTFRCDAWSDGMSLTYEILVTLGVFLRLGSLFNV